MVNRVLREQARILRSGGYVAFEVGEVRKGKVLFEKLVCGLRKACLLSICLDQASFGL